VQHTPALIIIVILIAFLAIIIIIIIIIIILIIIVYAMVMAVMARAMHRITPRYTSQGFLEKASLRCINFEIWNMRLTASRLE